MPTPCAPRARGENEIHLELPSPATTYDVAVVLADARLQDARPRVVLDCGGAEKLPPPALAELSRLGGELRRRGGDLVPVNCGASLRQALENPSTAGPFGGTSVRDAAHRLRGPHASFLRSFRSGD